MTQPQAQAPPVIPSGPAISEEDLKDVETRSVRSVSSKRSRTYDLTPTLSKRVRSILQHPADPSLPKVTTHEGQVLLLSHLRPVLNVLRHASASSRSSCI